MDGIGLCESSGELKVEECDEGGVVAYGKCDHGIYHENASCT
jgi:hypothetical protein